MKAITLWQPWASWIAAGWKRIETRRHPRFAGLVGQRIAIHAGKTWDGDWYLKAHEFLTANQIAATHGSELAAVRSAVLCTAFIVGHRQLQLVDSQAALCPCTPDARLWGIVLASVLPLPAPIPARGFPGAWKWTPEPDQEDQGR